MSVEDLHKRNAIAVEQMKFAINNLEIVCPFCLETDFDQNGYMTISIGTVNGTRPYLTGRTKMFNPIDTAPLDGTPVEVKTAGGFTFKAAFQDHGFMNELEEECGCWVAEGEGEPECWTDGVCWESNADERPSDPPIGWCNLSSGCEVKDD